MIRRTSVIALIIFSIAILVNCQSPQSDYLAKVNGEKITVSDFLATLPKSSVNDVATQCQEHLTKLINRRLIIQKAKAMGLMEQVANSLELSKKTMLIQKLMEEEIIKKAKATPIQIQQLYEILPEVVHLRLIVVNTEDAAQLVKRYLQAGVPFESCAYKFSSHPSSKSGGDVGYGRLAFLPEPIRLAVTNLPLGKVSSPIPTDEGFTFVQLLAKRTEPIGSLAQEEPALRSFLEEQKAKELHRRFFAQLNSRLTYNYKALRVFFKPANAITEEEKELWVCKKDETLFVRVKSLLPIAESFNPAIDTALRIYAIKREIEDDLLYEEAKKRGFDKDQKILAELAKVQDELLYQAFYNNEISGKVSVSDEAILEYYRKEQANYPTGWNESVKNLIRSRLLAEANQQVEAELLEKLKKEAKIEINQPTFNRLIAEIKKERRTDED
ncbi:MAG: peptidylprolyl isomerase [candidate division WOR-3 bacterium]